MRRRSRKAALALDPWHQQIADFVKSKPVGAAFTTAEVLDRLGVDESHRERSHEMRVENVLRELRWMKAHELEYLETYAPRGRPGCGGLVQAIDYCDRPIPLPEWASCALLTIDLSARSRGLSRYVGGRDVAGPLRSDYLLPMPSAFRLPSGSSARS